VNGYHVTVTAEPTAGIHEQPRNVVSVWWEREVIVSMPHDHDRLARIVPKESQLANGQPLQWPSSPAWPLLLVSLS
jgi:hypothetical protein